VTADRPLADLGRDPFALRDGEVCVWWTRLDASLPLLAEASLCTDEKQRADRFLFGRDRRRFVACRATLRQIIGGYLSVEPGAVAFRYQLGGKPELAPHAAPDGSVASRLRFNVSHSGEIAVYGIALGCEVGVDVEAIREVDELDAIVARNFSSDERASFARLAPEARPDGFFAGWTRKEAFLKATGEGLSRPLHTFSVSLGTGEAARLLEIDGDTSEAAQWTVHDCRVTQGHVAAVAVRRAVCRVSVRRWPLAAQTRTPLQCEERLES